MAEIISPTNLGHTFLPPPPWSTRQWVVLRHFLERKDKGDYLLRSENISDSVNKLFSLAQRVQSAKNPFPWRAHLCFSAYWKIGMNTRWCPSSQLRCTRCYSSLFISWEQTHKNSIFTTIGHTNRIPLIAALYSMYEPTVWEII